MRNSHLPHDCCYCTLIFKCAIHRKLFVQLLTFVFLLVHEYLVFLLISCFWRSLWSCVKYHKISALSIYYYKVKAWAWIPLAIFVYSIQQWLANYPLKYISCNEKNGNYYPCNFNRRHFLHIPSPSARRHICLSTNSSQLGYTPGISYRDPGNACQDYFTSCS